MGEELLIAMAQVVKAGIAIAVVGESVAGAFAVTGEAPLTFAALSWQCVALVPSEGALLLSVDE